MNDIVKIENQYTSIIEKMATNPDVDVVKLEKMLDMQERIMAKQAEIDFNIAMTEMQPNIPIIKHTKKAHNSSYAPYDEIERTIKPVYTKHGFSIRFNQKSESEFTTYTCILSHKNGHSVSADIRLPNDTSGGKNAIQSVASTVSYAKRYLVSMLLNIATTNEDNDGNSFATVTDEQSKALENLAEQVGMNIENFVGYFEASSISDIKQSDYRKAYAILMKKGAENENS